MSNAGTPLGDELRGVRERLLSVVAGVTEDQFKRRPEGLGQVVASQPHSSFAAGWSIAEVLAHLLASHRLQATRLHALLEGARDTPEDATGDDEILQSSARAGRAAPVPQLIHGLLAAYRELEAILGRAVAGDGHEEVLERLRRDVVEVEAAHASRIEAIRAELGAGTASRQ